MSYDFKNPVKTLALPSLLLALICCSCSAVTKKVARDATPEAIEAGLEAGTSEETQEKLVEAIEPERVEQATEKLAAGATDGWASAMGEDERQARVAAAVTPVVASLVQESMQTALGDEHLVRIRELAKQATLGFQDAIDEVAQKREEGAIPSDRGNVLEAVDKVAEGGDRWLYALGALAALLAALLGAGIAWAIGRKRRYDREAARRDQALEAALRVLEREGLALESAEAPGPRAEGVAYPTAASGAPPERVRGAQRMASAR